MTGKSVPFYDRFTHFSEEWIGINLAKTRSIS